MIGALIARAKAPAAFEALNRHDVDALLANYADDVEFVYPGDVGPHGRHVGKPAVEALLRRIFRQFPRIQFSVRHVAVANAFDLVGSNVVYTHWDAEFTSHDGQTACMDGVTVATLRRGKVVRIEDYFDASDQGHRRCWATPAG